MEMHSCLTCEYRETPRSKHPCKKGLTDEKGFVINCLGHSELTNKKRKLADMRGEKND